MKIVSLALLTTATVLSVSASYAAESAYFPGEFRRWVHVGTGVIVPSSNPQMAGEDGMHHIFANQKAVDGYASGDFADGSIIVYELRQAQQKNGVIFEGERKRVDLMIKDPSLKGTGGWRFERFWGADQTQNALRDSGTACFQCHSKASTHGFVFSKLQ